jgi:D-amino-acid oxidase
MREIEAHVDGFHHSVDIIAESGLNPKYSSPVLNAYEHLAPIIDTDQYMLWIRERALSLGARLLTERIHGLLIRVCASRPF